MQRSLLLDEAPTDSQAWDVSYMGLYDDGKLCQQSHDTMVGRLMSQWWDVSTEAGPRARADVSFQEEIPSLDVLTINQDEKTVQNPN